MATREPIYVALFNLLTGAPGIAGAFNTYGRYLRHNQQAGPMPCFYLVQHPGESHVKVGKGIPSKRTLRSHVVMYFTDGSVDSILPATLCNNAMDAIDNALNINLNPSNAQTLGGLVEHVYLEGEVSIAEGLLQEISIVTVPITILIP